MIRMVIFQKQASRTGFSLWSLYLLPSGADILDFPSLACLQSCQLYLNKHELLDLKPAIPIDNYRYVVLAFDGVLKLLQGRVLHQASFSGISQADMEFKNKITLKNWLPFSNVPVQIKLINSESTINNRLVLKIDRQSQRSGLAINTLILILIDCTL